MQQFIRRNARTAALLNLVINTVIPAGILWPVASVGLRGGPPNWFTVLLPAVGISALATTIATFATLPGKPANQSWLLAALLNGLRLALLFGLPVALGLLLVKALTTTNLEVDKITALVVSALTGAAVGALASWAAVRRAASFFHLPLRAARY